MKVLIFKFLFFQQLLANPSFSKGKYSKCIVEDAGNVEVSGNFIIRAKLESETNYASSGRPRISRCFVGISNTVFLSRFFDINLKQSNINAKFLNTASVKPIFCKNL